MKLYNISKSVHEVALYVNWAYFFHAWGFPARYAGIAQQCGCQACRQGWQLGFQASERERAAEAVKLYDAARSLLREWDKAGLRTHFRVALFSACSDGDDILLDSTHRLCFLRQQQAGENGSCLCLSDFVRPLSMGGQDTVGLFASTVDADMEHWNDGDDYMRLLSQTLADRLAEATAEAGHLLVRRSWWGYAPDENLSIPDLFQERYQGIRPAVGYPSIPDQSVIFQLASLLDFPSLGISLTENGAMLPHASTSGLLLSHPEARHFSVGPIGQDQFLDYARRRGEDPQNLRRFLNVLGYRNV